MTAVPLGSPTRELLLWLAARRRSYEETIEAWKTSCPRLSVWDDAVIDGLVEVVRQPSGPVVTVTARGRAALAASRPAA